MCPPKPKIPKPSETQPKDPAIIRNSYLDGVDPKTRSMRTGRSSLRIPKGSGRTPAAPAAGYVPVSPVASTPPGGIPRPPPVAGGGGGGRGISPRNIHRY